MELIVQLKQAEAQAREIVEQAKAAAAKRVEQARQRSEQEMAAAQTARKRAIEQAVAEAMKQGKTQADALKEEAAHRREELQARVAGRTDRCIGRVMDFLKGI